MNQIISKHGNDGSLRSWLSKQCPAFRGGKSCSKSHTITSEEQGWINEALGGSNNIRFAIGNATGGSTVGAGKIVCVWDGSKCCDDVDYTVNDGKSGCSTYSSSASFGECWGLEGEDAWAKEMEGNCGSSGCSTLRSSPDYNSTEYQSRISNLHNLSQISGTFKDYKMCEGSSYKVSGSRCGMMSLYAAYYLFSSQGLNDGEFFSEFLSEAKKDGYNVCSAGSIESFSDNLKAVTQISGKMIATERVYWR